VVLSGLAVATGPFQVVAFDPGTGEVLWTLDRETGALDPPAIGRSAGGRTTVVYAEGNSAENSGVVAIDAADRSVRWRLDLDGPGRGAPAIEDGTVFVGSHAGSLYAIDLDTGETRWRFRGRGRVDTAPAVAEGIVFVVSEDFESGAARLLAVDAESGDEIWGVSQPAVSVRVSSATVGDGTVFVGFGDQVVRGFDAATGALRWEAPVRGTFSPLSVPAFAGGDLYTSDRSGSIYRLDGGTGASVWDFQLPSAVVRGSPLVAGRYVYAGFEDGTLAAFEASSGDLVWRSRLAAGPVGAPAPAGELLLVPSMGERGGIVAFRTDPDGSLVRIESPTRLDLLTAVLNFVAASALLAGALLGFFRFLVRPGSWRWAAEWRGKLTRSGEPS
jgi:outer membrane protein assembly factor BamB